MENEVFDRLALEISEFCGVPKSKIEQSSSILFDLGIDADDGKELIEHLAYKFGFSLEKYEHEKFFYEEADFFAIRSTLFGGDRSREKKSLTVRHLLDAMKTGILDP